MVIKNRHSDIMNSGGTEKKGKRVSISSENVLDIQPIVYSFKVPPHSHTSGSVVTAARPPQWLYHDHVMGVIWMIFHKEKNYVGISQLQWCLTFLLDLKNSQGEYTGDVKICIQAIQDNLIEQYAKLGPALEKTIQEKSREKDVTNESVLEDNESKRSLKTNVTDSTINNDNEEGDKDLTIPDIKGIIGTSTPNEEESEIWGYEKKQITKKSEKKCGDKCATADANKQKEEMLSFTYNEMVSRGPSPCTQSYLIEDISNDQQSVEHTEAEQVDLPTLNANELVNFLNTSKKQHVEKMNQERETLRILERLLENFNISGLSPNNIDDLKKSLQNLQSGNITKETEQMEKLNE